MTQSFRPFISVLQRFTASPDHMPSLVSFRVSRQEKRTSNLGHLDQTQNGLHFGHFFNIFLDFSTCLGVLPSLASLYSVWIGKGIFPSGLSQKTHMEISSFLFPPININWAFFSQPHIGFLHQSWLSVSCYQSVLFLLGNIKHIIYFMYVALFWIFLQCPSRIHFIICLRWSVISVSGQEKGISSPSFFYQKGNVLSFWAFP